jgi:hypothetical protein
VLDVAPAGRQRAAARCRLRPAHRFPRIPLPANSRSVRSIAPGSTLS